MKFFATSFAMVVVFTGASICNVAADVMNHKTDETHRGSMSTGIKVSGDKIIADLIELPPVLANNPLVDLQAVVEADKTQVQRGNGVSLIINITNTGRQAVTISNPLDYLSVSIANDKGLPIELPPSYSRFQVDGPKKADGDELHLPFEIKRVSLNRRTITQKEMQLHSFLLPPKTRLQIALSINRVVTSSKQVPVLDSRDGTTSYEPVKTLGNIRPGTYQVVVQLLLSQFSGFRGKRMLQTSPISVTLT